MKKLADWFLALTRETKRAILVGVDVMFAVFALWGAFSLRLGEWYVPDDYIWVLFCINPLLAVPVFVKFGLYRAIIRYIGGRALWSIFQAVTLHTVIFTFVVFLFGPGIGLVPRTVPFLYWLVFLLLVGGSRFVARWWLAESYSKLGGIIATDCVIKKVIIYGAGSAGIQLASALELGHEFRPVAYIDDKESLQRQKINGLRIYPLISLNYLIERHKVNEVLLAIPSAPLSRKREIIQSLEPYPVHVKTMPGLADIAQGKIKFDELQEVDIADLLGREPVEPDQALFHANIVGKVVMVTGAGGSIGSELCRQIIALKPAKIILFELNEYALYLIDKELTHAVKMQKAEQGFEIISILGSVVDGGRVKNVCHTFNVQTIYHAAAYKHVPMVEKNPAEAIRNNIFGTLSLAQAAIESHVETFVLISTDKAVRPTNTMGASKRFAELILQGLTQKGGHSTSFTMVRFGNVLGSSGSVIPLFREQIARGGPVTVTDPKIIRYFMTIPEAAQLVIQAGAMGKGGDVFVLDMGEPILILDLAKRMIHLTGLQVKDINCPKGEVEIKFTGLRAGEKLFEELLIGDNVSETAHCRIMRAEEEVIVWPQLETMIAKLRKAVQEEDVVEIRQVLIKCVSGFLPQCEINDWLWIEEQKEIVSH